MGIRCLLVICNVIRLPCDNTYLAECRENDGENMFDFQIGSVHHEIF